MILGLDDWIYYIKRGLKNEEELILSSIAMLHNIHITYILSTR